MKQMMLMVAVCVAALGCGGQPTTETAVDANEFEKSITENKVQLLDVRTMNEYNSGHIKNALQADWTNKDQFFERIKYVDKDKSVYIYCLSGGRSSAAAAWMRQNGYTNVVELKGGINAWKNAGKPVDGASTIKQMTIEEYNAKIAGSKTVLVDFGATWCPPCIKMEPVIHEVLKEKGEKISFVKVDGGNDTDVMKANNVDALPVLIIYKNGKETWRNQGMVDKATLLSHLN